ncbi:PucR family transcriptional regulator ligand-binding domain-containing protein [Catenulispora sp. EB89]|uniref:PucR family transcriptional regulator n=1 Tax=Catenulispora sp. EB89 TaxID=3156257 RepID=UPI003511CE35
MSTPATRTPAPIGLTVTQALALPALAGARIVAGHAGHDRVVERVNVMEVPDILPWVKPKELLLTTGYPLRHSPSPLTDLIGDLDRAGLSAIAIKPHRYLGDLPPELLAAADALGFPVIELPEGVAFDDILTDVLSDVLDRQSAVLARADHVHRTLAQIALEGGGLAELAAELANILGGPVLVTTPDGRVLAEHGADAVRHLPCFDAAPGPDADHRLRTEAEQPGLTAHHGTQHALVPIVAGRVDHGRLVAFAGRRAFDAADVAALERAATVAALSVVKQLAVAAVEDKYRADFLRDLLTGRLEDLQSAAAHAATLGWDISPGRAPAGRPQNGTRGPGQYAGHQTGRQTGQQAGHQTGQQAGHQTGQQAGHQTGQQAGHQTGQYGATTNGGGSGAAAAQAPAGDTAAPTPADAATPAAAAAAAAASGTVSAAPQSPAAAAQAPRPTPHLMVLVAELDPGQSVLPASQHALRPARERFAAAWQTVVAARDRTNPVAGFNQEVVVVLKTGDDPDPLVKSLIAEVSGTGGGGRRTFSTGVSRRVATVADLPAAYEEARRAVRIGRRLNGPGSVAHFDALGVYRLLSLVPDPAELRDFARQTLKGLAADGDPDAEDLRTTLEVLLDTNLNVAEAARRLHFHYNTLRYRIGKIERLVGPFMERPDLRLDLSVALRILHMRGL